jgi:hypothetical protein
VSPAHANGQTGIFDLEEAAQAATTEAAEETFPFVYKGEHYEVPPGRSWPVSALSALAAGELETALGELLGAETYAQLAKAGLTVGELNALFSAVGVSAGFPSLPNSRPPARPSSSRVSKRR